MGIPYRIRQFLLALAPASPEDETELVHRFLSPELEALFFQMSPSDQRHSLRVLRALLEGGEDDPDLLAAALLHDVGKSRATPSPLERVLVVVSGFFMPGKAAQWGQGEPRGWRRPFVVAAQHPAWGGEMVQACGGSEKLVRLIRDHQERPAAGQQEADLLAKLQQADGRN